MNRHLCIPFKIIICKNTQYQAKYLKIRWIIIDFLQSWMEFSIFFFVKGKKTFGGFKIYS